MAVKSTNITEVAHHIDIQARWQANGHRGAVLWFTGLSGAGKTTLALELENRLFNKGFNVYVLDGDNVRHGLSSDLGFSHSDRTENIRRIGEVAALFADAGAIVITAFISPYQSDREQARQAYPEGFREIFIDADLEVCERRDPKGLYEKARKGEIPDFTGISAPYEAPSNPDLTVDSGDLTVDESLQILMDYVEETFVLK